MFCSKCGKPVVNGIKFCEHCGATLTNGMPPQSREPQSMATDEEPIVENNKELAIAGVVCAGIGLIVLPLLGILGIIFGAIALVTNKNYDSLWKFKPIWKYKNKAWAFGYLSLVWGIIDVIWLITHL